jgi:hypothetical protein
MERQLAGDNILETEQVCCKEMLFGFSTSACHIYCFLRATTRTACSTNIFVVLIYHTTLLEVVIHVAYLGAHMYWFCRLECFPSD